MTGIIEATQNKRELKQEQSRNSCKSIFILQNISVETINQEGIHMKSQILLAIVGMIALIVLTGCAATGTSVGGHSHIVQKIDAGGLTR